MKIGGFRRIFAPGFWPQEKEIVSGRLSSCAFALCGFAALQTNQCGNLQIGAFDQMGCSEVGGLVDQRDACVEPLPPEADN